MAHESLKTLKALAAFVQGATEGESLLSGELLGIPNDQMQTVFDCLKDAKEDAESNVIPFSAPSQGTSQE